MDLYRSIDMTHRTAYILLNGPPSSGKSQALAPLIVDAIKANNLTVHRDEFAAPLKHFIATSLGLKYQQAKKDIPMAILNGYSIREFLIFLSQDYIKEVYGQDIYGRWLHYRILRLDAQPDFVLVDDLGFSDEMQSLQPHFVIRLTRPGHIFQNDSRDFIAFPDYEIVNDGTIEQLQKRVGPVMMDIIEKTRRMRE